MNENLDKPTPEKKSKFTNLILAFLGIGLVSYCVFGIFVLLKPKQTVNITPTLTQSLEYVSATPSQKAQKLIDDSANWEIVFKEPFDSRSDAWANGWEYGMGSSKEIDSNIDFKNGKYTWEVTSKNSILVTLASTASPELQDFRISADVKLTSGTYKPDYGVLFRDTPNSGSYFFGIHGEQFVVLKYLNGNLTNLIDYQKSKAVLPEESNQITVIGQGDYFVFLINNQFVYELTNNDIKKGDFGYGVWLNQKDLHNSFEFDNFVLSTP